MGPFSLVGRSNIHSDAWSTARPGIVLAPTPSLSLKNVLEMQSLRFQIKPTQKLWVGAQQLLQQDLQLISMQANVSRTPVPKRCMKDHEMMCCKNSTMAELHSCDTDHRVYQKYLLFGSLQKNFANPFTWPLCAHTFTYTCTHTYTRGWVILSMNAPLHIYKLLLHLGGVTFTCHHPFLTSHSPLKALTSFIPLKLLFS